MPRPPRFTIRAASALTGINQNTLRAWERRHGLIRPERTPKGYRLYSESDILRLRAIQHVLQEGVPIGRVRSVLEAAERDGSAAPPRAAASHSGTRLTRIVEVSLASAGLDGRTTIRVPADRPAPDGQPQLAAFSKQLEQAAQRLDRTALERAFTRAVGLHSLRHAFHHALLPALARLDGRPESDRPGHEGGRFLATFAREKLTRALAGLRPLHQQPRALFACAPGERDESALMLLSLEVGLEGVSVGYLGADAPVDQMLKAAREAGSRAVVLSATQALPRETVRTLRDRLAALPRRPRLMVAGAAAARERDWLQAQGVELLSPEPEEAGAQVLRAIGQD